MIRYIILDAAPLGLIAQREGILVAERCRDWVANCLQASIKVYVPSVADFEVRRELTRINSKSGIGRLDAFETQVPDRLISVTDDTLRLGADLWARARNAGTPTGDPKELDCDVLIAAQALSLRFADRDFVVATSNVGHLSQFVPARLWTQIDPGS